MVGAIAAFVITMLKRIAKDEVVDLIGTFAAAVLFILILVISFLFGESDALWALIFGYWACECENDMKGE